MTNFRLFFAFRLVKEELSIFYDKKVFGHIQIFRENLIFQNIILLVFVTQEARMLVSLGKEGFSGDKMSTRQTYSEIIPEKLSFGVKIGILVLAKIKQNKNIARKFFFAKRSGSFL